jgi:hypothetical protein
VQDFELTGKFRERYANGTFKREVSAIGTA